MPRIIGKLTPLAIKNMKGKGLYADGAGLYLRITATETKSWIFRYMKQGKAHSMGLGTVHAVSLAEAREKARTCCNLLASGQDPLAQKRQALAQQRLDAAKAITFQKCAKAYIETHKAGWKNPKHAQQWTNTLETYAYPVFGNLSVQDIDLTFIKRVLTPIWSEKNETASRLRGRIESVLDWAKTNGYRVGENPARWKGHLENVLPTPSRIQKETHFSSLPYQKIGAFLSLLSSHPGTSAQALKLLILTAIRTNECIQAQWKEFDMEKAVWTIPAERMKMGREHRIPLSPQAMNILIPYYQAHDGNRNKTSDDYVFENKKKRPLSNMAMLQLLRRMDRRDITVHGFRSTFRNWAAEQTAYPREIAEAALAHKNGNGVEAAYLHTDFFDKRREMMDAWSRYCFTTMEEAT